MEKEFTMNYQKILNSLIKFKKNNIKVKKLNISTNILKFLENNLTLVYTGFPRKAHYIEKDKISLIKQKKNYYILQEEF